jgi:outer membrane protein OmpA-like peptidoglycan-associated protein
LRRIVLGVVVSALLLGGCSKSSENTAAATASPSPTEQATSAPAPAATASASPGTSASSATPTPTPSPTPTPDANLLDWQNGTIVRSYTSGGTNDPNDFARYGVGMPSGSTVPAVFTYELPGAATIASFSVDLPATDSGKPAATVDVAIATDGPTGDFRDLGTLTGGDVAATKSLTPNAAGRWVRITAAGPTFTNLVATGTLAPLPATASPVGIYVEADGKAPYANGVFLNHSFDTDPWYRKIATVGTAMSGARCFDGHLGGGYPGTLNGRVWAFSDSGNASQAVVNDDASLIVGVDNGLPLYLMRVTTQPKWCVPQTSGTGANRVLVLDSNAAQVLWPIEQNGLAGYSYTRMHASMLDQSALNGAGTVILNMLCNAQSYLSKGQTDALLQWVSAGHKLLVVDSDACSASSYDFLPYPFHTSNPGARGASGDRLIIVENDALGASDKSDAHFFDPNTFINKGSNQLGDANIVTTNDSHWCGHLFGTNANHDNGFMQMYAPYGQGIIIYDGFDHDDATNLGYERVRTLELQLPVPAGMPCSQTVAASFIVQPSAEATFTTGKAQTLPFSMETLASLGWSGHVTIATTGDFPASVTPAAFDLAGTTQPLRVAVKLPASAKAGVYTITVTGSDAQGHASQATISLTAVAPLVKKIKKHQRIRIYGIHFDVDSAHIQPQSEKVIKEIADLMKGNPAVRFQVEGHTDSDGGATYNLGLSQRRAQAVVNDLVARYGIARSRLVPKGFGLTKPVKPNTTPANKALNRRVELLAL